VIFWLTTLSAQTLITTVAGRARPILGASGAPATSFPLDDPCAVAADSNGNVYFTDIGYNMAFRISNGSVYPFAGTGAPQSGPTGGKAVQTAIEAPFATDIGGNVYFTEFEGLTRVLKVDTTGAITTVAGGGANVLQFSSFLFGDGGPASRATLFEPYGVAVDASGNVFVSNQSGNRISKVSPGGIITSLIGILPDFGFPEMAAPRNWR
jgi:trimeric autotransporter adhesin